MLKSLTTGASIISIALLSNVSFADDTVYGKFPVTLKGYSGSKTNSVSYTGQIARHALHDSLKKLAGKGNGQPNQALKAQMMSYFQNKDQTTLKGIPIETKERIVSEQTAYEVKKTLFLLHQKRSTVTWKTLNIL